MKEKVEKMKRGSFTVESAILIPLLISVMALSISSAIEMYKESRDKKEEDQRWMVGEFYIAQGIKEVTGNGS